LSAQLIEPFAISSIRVAIEIGVVVASMERVVERDTSACWLIDMARQLRRRFEIVCSSSRIRPRSFVKRRSKRATNDCEVAHHRHGGLGMDESFTSKLGDEDSGL
jgi:hypothetical protein